MSLARMPADTRLADGGGVQGISSLLILDRLMRNTANKTDTASSNSLKPCDVFDMIAGIGAGRWVSLSERILCRLLNRIRWLALLLGCIRLSVVQCMIEYQGMSKAIIRPETLAAKARTMCGLPIFDVQGAVRYVERLCERMKTSESLGSQNMDDVRCK